MVTVVFGQSTNPIPSYNVLITGKAIFVDQSSAEVVNNNQILSAEKRDMNVDNNGGGSNSPDPNQGPSIVVYIFTLDHSIVLGPYIVPSGQNISVPIDDSAWGVAIGTDSQVNVSVWTDDGKDQ